MRLLVEIMAEKDSLYDAMYYHKLQGFVYNLLRSTCYEKLHDKKSYKFFCFSNIFPSSQKKPINKGDIKHFIISSPDKMFISITKDSLTKLIGENIGIGEMFFSMKGVKEIKPVLHDNCEIKTATPIIIREHRKLLSFGIDCGFGELNSMGFGFVNVVK